MAEKDTGQERTEEPTPKKLADARKEGNVPRSKELDTAATTLAAAVLLMFYAPFLLQQLEKMMVMGVDLDAKSVRDTGAMMSHLGTTLFDAILVVLPVALATILISLATPMAMGGFIFTPKGFMPKLSKLNPIAGLGRMFGPKSWVELGKAILKVLIIGGLFVGLFWLRYEHLITLIHLDINDAIGVAAREIGWAFVALCVGLLLIAAVDVPYQLYSYKKQNMMTRQEIKDEMKEAEGRPEVKAKLRQMGREIAFSRMMQAVPEADVIITNPTHYSVALKYDPKKHRAPVLVAKGRDLIAAQIREKAKEHNVPIVQAPPLARALWASTKLEQAIPGQLFTAVAQVLAFVLQLKVAKRQGLSLPKAPNPSVPQEFLQRYNVEQGPTE
ncbi:MAG: flagellar biosynthesis protein FlhB [Gammaproteobacteria bacterium]|nr:flagellar biosynthesis protein FlhB [Gammaproteobacteria bacterium]